MEYNAKFMWSRMSRDRLEQWVVRCDDPDEFLDYVTLVRKMLPETAIPPDYGDNSQHNITPLPAPLEVPEVEQEPALPREDDPAYCSLHQAYMKERISKAGNRYLDHRWQENGVWHKCNGRGEY